MKNFLKSSKFRLILIFCMVVFSIALALMSPFEDLISRAEEQNFSFILAVLIIGEACFLGGILVMAAAAGHDIGMNPLKWRGHIQEILKKIVEDRIFWLGFWLNFAGAVATTLIAVFLVVSLLPARSWGLALLGSIDVIVTISLRREVLSLRK